MKTPIELAVCSVCAVAVAALTAAGRRAPRAAKGTLVYCSEGSPEGFQPQFFTTGTTFDAVSVPMFNRLVEFEIGTTNIVPALAESWTVSPDGKIVHVQAAQGRQVPQQRELQADARLQRRRRAVLVVPDGRRQPSVPQDSPAGQTFAYFDDMGMKNIVDKVEKVDDYTVRFTLKRPEAPFLADMAMDFASILSKEYFETMLKKGTPECGRRLSDRHRTVRVRQLPEGRDDPLQGVRPLLGRPAEDRQPGLLDHARRHGALREAEDRRVPRDGVPEAGRSRRDAARIRS